MIKDDKELEELFPNNSAEELSLSYSKISSFDQNGVRSLESRIFLEGDGIMIGRLTDDLLFNKESISENYHIYNGTKPTATLGELTDIVLRDFNKIPTKNKILRIIKKNGFWSKIKNQELVLARFDIPEFWDYLEAMYISENKSLVTSEQDMIAKELRDILLSHKNSKNIFDSNYISQYKFSMKYYNFIIRGIIDMIQIDDENKTIRFIDLKTGEKSIRGFMKSFIEYRYYLQSLIYTLAAEVVKIELNLKDYKVLPFQFLYIGRKQKIPMIFEVSQKWINAAKNGFTTVSGLKRKGLDELLDDIRWHLHNKVFDVSREICESNGFMELEDDFIIIK